jgi:hypothetical protein
MANGQYGDQAVEALEKALNLKLPDNCDIHVSIRDFNASEGKSHEIRVNLVRQNKQAKKFDVTRLVGDMSDAHRT